MFELCEIVLLTTVVPSLQKCWESLQPLLLSCAFLRAAPRQCVLTAFCRLLGFFNLHSSVLVCTVAVSCVYSIPFGIV